MLQISCAGFMERGYFRLSISVRLSGNVAHPPILPDIKYLFAPSHDPRYAFSHRID
jgi:hypothetical protein